MKNLMILTLTILMMVIICGCSGPKLAQTNYGPVEKKWEGYLKKSYPAWSPPKTMPPASSDNNIEVIEVQEEVITVEDTNDINVGAVETTGEPVIDTAIVDINPKPAKVSAPEGSMEKYTVQKGDTLWKIAKKFYQKGSKWPVILEANKEVIVDPKNIRPGMELVIPAQ